MDPFQLTEDAILDIDAIWLYFRERADLETADRIVAEIFKGFYRLAEMPARDHRRPDLTSRPVLFYRIFSYLIIYQFGSEPLQILGVLHGKRNIARILRQTMMTVSRSGERFKVLLQGPTSNVSARIGLPLIEQSKRR